jgi:hypothetical protein
VSPVRYELGFYIPEGDIFHSHRRETLFVKTNIIFNNRGFEGTEQTTVAVFSMNFPSSSSSSSVSFGM